jgi:RHS repeat-associated protein
MTSAAPVPSLAVERAEQWLAARREARKHDQSRCSFDASGDLLRIDEPDGSWAEFTYDARRCLIRALRSYSDTGRIEEICSRGVTHRYEYDARGRPSRTSRGNAGGSVFRYDDAGRVLEMRTSSISIQHRFDDAGNFRSIQQTIDGVAAGLSLEYDDLGRLLSIVYPGAHRAAYEWTDRGWPLAVRFDGEPIVFWRYQASEASCIAEFGNGVQEKSLVDSTDARPVWRQWSQGPEPLGTVAYEYGPTGQIAADGERSYRYDSTGRLSRARCERTGRDWVYSYDAAGNLLRTDGPAAGRDSAMRLEYKVAGGRSLAYRYNDTDQLIEVTENGSSAAAFEYDAKGRLARLRSDGCAERFLYGPADELLAITDDAGRPKRLWVRTPTSVAAEIEFDGDDSVVRYLHQDPRGTTRLVTTGDGIGGARLDYDPFGLPLAGDVRHACYHGRIWFPELGLYYFGARWYDPEVGQFLTPDSYTALPDDYRILNPLTRAGSQSARRAILLDSWLRHAQLRNRVAFCGNDPINNADPNGHWSVFGVILSILLAIWTLPNTLFGLLIEITCILGEGIRLLLSLISGGSVDWESIGFDVAGSGRLNAFALVFEGGWIGSFSSLLGITFNNVFFVYKQWPAHPHISSGGNVSPAAYGGTVSFPRTEALYEHELRHTNQYGWFGPFFHLGLPIFGIYEWDIIFNGYSNSWLERDATNHGGI